MGSSNGPLKPERPERPHGPDDPGRPEQPAQPARPQEPRLGRFGRVAAGLFGLHVALLFFPPIPPDVKGSLWSYIIAYLAVIFAALEFRGRGPALVRHWSRWSSSRRLTFGIGTAIAILAAG